jgi:hypothetical protein
VTILALELQRHLKGKCFYCFRDIPVKKVLLQMASAEGDGVLARWSYAVMPKIAWTNWRCATASPLATQRT